MNKSALKVLGAVLVISATANVRATDMEPGLNFAVGPAFTQDTEIHNTGSNVSFDTGYHLNMGFNYKLVWDLNAEVQTGVIHNGVDSIGRFPSSDGDLYQVPVMFNVSYDLPCHLPLDLVPSIGVGLGTTFAIFSAGPIDDWDPSIAYQFMAGLKRDIGGNMNVGLGYNYFGTADHEWSGLHTDGTATHSILFTFNYRF